MLIFNDKLLKTRRINQIVTPVYEDEDKQEGLIGYIYSDLDTYRQAVTLQVRFEGELTSLTGLLNVASSNMKYIEYYRDKTPYPFKMFAPYLGLVAPNEKLEENLENLISHLHIIGRAISFSDFVTVPAAVRVNMTFTKTSFLTMKEEVRDYTVGLYETERDESPDGVYWISSEEVDRVGRIATAISEAFGGMAVQSAGQTAAAFNSSANTSSDSGDGIVDAVKREMADFEDTFDPAEWEGFEFQTFDGDFSDIGKTDAGGSNQAATSVQAASAPSITTSAQIDAAEEPEAEDAEDLLMMMARGVDATNNMLGGN